MLGEDPQNIYRIFASLSFSLRREVLQEGGGVDQLLGDLPGECEHGKASVLELLQFVFRQFLRRGSGVKARLEDLGIGARAGLRLEEADRLEDGDDAEGQPRPDGIGVEDLQCGSGGGEEVVSEGTVGGVLFGEEHAEDRKLGESAVHDLHLAVALELLGGGLRGESGGVEESHRGEVADEAIRVGRGGEGDVLLAGGRRLDRSSLGGLDGGGLLHGCGLRRGGLADGAGGQEGG